MDLALIYRVYFTLCSIITPSKPGTKSRTQNKLYIIKLYSIWNLKGLIQHHHQNTKISSYYLPPEQFSLFASWHSAWHSAYAPAIIAMRWEKRRKKLKVDILLNWRTTEYRSFKWLLSDMERKPFLCHLWVNMSWNQEKFTHHKQGRSFLWSLRTKNGMR